MPVRRTSTRLERPASTASQSTLRGRDGESVETTEQHQNEFVPDLDDLSEVVMAVNMTDRGTVGCAYYVTRDEKLYFMEDAKLGGCEILDSCTYGVGLACVPY